MPSGVGGGVEKRSETATPDENNPQGHPLQVQGSSRTFPGRLRRTMCTRYVWPIASKFKACAKRWLQRSIAPSRMSSTTTPAESRDLKWRKRRVDRSQAHSRMGGNRTPGRKDRATRQHRALRQFGTARNLLHGNVDKKVASPSRLTSDISAPDEPLRLTRRITCLPVRTLETWAETDGYRLRGGFSKDRSSYPCNSAHRKSRICSTLICCMVKTTSVYSG